MAFTARTRAEIRDQLLGYWSAEYSARGETLLTSEGSDAYLLASQIGVIQEALDAQAVQVSRDILPDQASTAALERFCRGQLAGYKLPREFRFVDSLPRTSAGKLQRSRLGGKTVDASD